MDVQIMSSKGSSTSSYLIVPTLFEHPMDVQQMSSKWSSTSYYLTDTTYVWTPHGRPNDVLKGILYKFLFECPNPIWIPHGRATDGLKGIVYQFLFECPNPIWTPHGRAKYVLKMIVYQFRFGWTNPVWTPQVRAKDVLKRDRLPVPIWLTQHLLEHPMNVQKMSSKWSSTCSYLTNTKPVWTPRGHAKDMLKGIVYQFLFDWHNTCLNTPWTSKRCPQRDPLQVPIWVSQPYLNTPWTCKRCPQRDRLPIPIWLTQNQFEHTMDIQKMSSKWSSTSFYLTDTTPAWAPHERAKDVLKMIVYLFLFDWHITSLNTPRTCKRYPQMDRLPVPIWLTQHLFEHPIDVQKRSSKGSSTSSYLSVPTLFEHPMDVQQMSSKGSSTSSY